MKCELLSLIEAYCTKAENLVPRLAMALNIKLPITNLEWAALDIKTSGTTNDGLGYFKHGFGVEIQFKGGIIDIDFGNNGEYKGFDAWRLYKFAKESRIDTRYKNEIDLKNDIIQAQSLGQLHYAGHLYYLNKKD